MALNIKITGAQIKKEKDEKDIQKLLEEPVFKKFLMQKEKHAYEIGYSKRSEEVLSLISSMQSIQGKFKNLTTEIIKQYEPKLINLALKASEKILERELVSGYAKLDAIIKPVLQNIPGATRAIIKLNPSDFAEFVSMNIKDEIVSAKSEIFIEIQADSSVTKGGCFIETDMGMVDATLETRIEKLMSSVKGSA